MKITYSAPIPVPIAGEDGALYGKPVLVAASNLRIRCTVTAGKNHNEDALIQFINSKVVIYLKSHGEKFEEKSFHYSIQSDWRIDDITCQTALIVVFVAALTEFHTGKVYPTETVNTLSYQIEKEYFHFSLGFFTSCSCYGGLVYFRKEFEFLKSIAKLSFVLPENIQKNLYLQSIPSLQHSPLLSIQELQKAYNRNTLHTEELLSSVEKATKRLVVAITQENETLFEATFTEICKLATELHPLPENFTLQSAKITGLGSGTALLYKPSKKESTDSPLIPFHLSTEGLLRTTE
jgi:mevalonate kinase